MQQNSLFVKSTVSPTPQPMQSITRLSHKQNNIFNYTITYATAFPERASAPVKFPIGPVLFFVKSS